MLIASLAACFSFTFGVSADVGQEKPTAKKLYEKMTMIGAPRTLPAKAKLETSGFRLCEVRKVGAAITREFRFKVGWTGAADGYKVTLWIDQETNLPVKRHVISTFKTSRLLSEEGNRQEWTEFYPKVEVNVKIDPAQFEIPE